MADEYVLMDRGKHKFIPIWYNIEDFINAHLGDVVHVRVVRIDERNGATYAYTSKGGSFKVTMNVSRDEIHKRIAEVSHRTPQITCECREGRLVEKTDRRGENNERRRICNTKKKQAKQETANLPLF